MEALKDLHSRAQGEVSIREALAELDVWGASATFSLTDYKDCHSNIVKLIKDWKELTNKVSWMSVTRGIESESRKIRHVSYLG